MADTPAFAKTPHLESGVATTAVTALNNDVPGNTVLICAAPADKPMNIVRLTAIPRAAITAATPAYLFASKNAAGTVQRLKDCTTIAQQTPSATVGPVKAIFGDYSENTPLRLGAGESLWGGLGSTQAGVVFQAEVADF
jgi:hypothetical protein